MFVHGMQIQVKHDTYLTWLYLHVSVAKWHSDPAPFYSKCWVNLNIPSTNISTMGGSSGELSEKLVT